MSIRSAAAGSTLLVLALVPAACSNDATGPGVETEAQLGADLDVTAAALDPLDVEANTGFAATFGPIAPPHLPALGMLVRTAYAQVKAEQGADAAEALVAELWQLHQEAGEARRAGDRETFIVKLRAAHEEAVRIVIEVLGTQPIERALDAAASRLADFRAAIDAQQNAGRDVVRLEHAYAQARSWLADAQTAFDARAYGAALSYAMHSLHLSNRALRHIHAHDRRNDRGALSARSHPPNALQWPTLGVRR